MVMKKFEMKGLMGLKMKKKMIMKEKKSIGQMTARTRGYSRSMMALVQRILERD